MAFYVFMEEMKMMASSSISAACLVLVLWGLYRLHIHKIEKNNKEYDDILKPRQYGEMPKDSSVSDIIPYGTIADRAVNQYLQTNKGAIQTDKDKNSTEEQADNGIQDGEMLVNTNTGELTTPDEAFKSNNVFKQTDNFYIGSANDQKESSTISQKEVSTSERSKFSNKNWKSKNLDAINDLLKDDK